MGVVLKSGGCMSREYEIQTANMPITVFAEIMACIKEKFPSAEITENADSLWIPSIDPKWIDFSIEQSEIGCFIVSNLNGDENSIIFQIIENVLNKSHIEYRIEDV
jgi:hypothetical protein